MSTQALSPRWWTRTTAIDNILTVGTLTTIARLAAGAKVAITANYFGAGDEIDAYLTAFLLPSLFGDAVTMAFTSALVPGLTRVRTRHGDPAAARLAASALTLALAVMAGVAIVFAVLSPGVIAILGSSFPGAKREIARRFFLALLLWLPVGAWISIGRGILYSKGRFAVAAGAQSIAPLLAILILFGGAARAGVWALVIAVLGGAAVEGCVLAITAWGMGYALFPAALIWTEELTAFARQFRPLALSAIFASTSILIDQAFAGALGSGSVSTFSYGTKLTGVLIVICATGLGTVLLPEFSTYAVNKDWPGLRRRVKVYVSAVFLVLVPVAGILVWNSPLLVRILFERGVFDPAVTPLVATVQSYALLELPFAVLFVIASQLATAMYATHVLAQVGTVAVVVHGLSAWMLSRSFGVPGLAIATSVTRIFALVLLVALLWRWWMQRRGLARD